ncbi:MAG: hypothetical protein IKO94_09000, partial [Selenomonadaceae bacterium]|nr:hypothetical protein [Selenomonadaceae bacterium]
MTNIIQPGNTEDPGHGDPRLDLPGGSSPQAASVGSSVPSPADEDGSAPAAFFADSDGHESAGSVPDDTAAEETAFAWSQEDAPSEEAPGAPVPERRLLAQCGSDIQDEDFVHPADRAEHLEQLPLD